VLYELGSGQEQRRDFAYLEVPAGQGQYTWIDYNNNGIPEVNEFEIAQFRDQMKYIRIFTPTNEFIKANYTQFNYNLQLNPRAVLKITEQSGALKKIAARINLGTSLQIAKKEIARNISQFNPFAGSLSDTSLITLGSVFANSFSFNRYSSKWGLDLNNVQTSNKALLTYGYETNRINDWNLRWRWNLNKRISIDMNSRRTINELITPRFANRNYRIITYVAEPRLSFTEGSRFRLSGSYRLDNKENVAGEVAQAKDALIHSLITEVKYNALQNMSVTGKFTFSQIRFTGTQPNSTVGFIMLDGLLPGKNYLWTIDFTRRLSNNLELNLRYDGRKPGEGRVVHTGNAAVRALF
jgi:hypothetical protein